MRSRLSRQLALASEASNAFLKPPSVSPLTCSVRPAQNGQKDETVRVLEIFTDREYPDGACIVRYFWEPWMIPDDLPEFRERRNSNRECFETVNGALTSAANGPAQQLRAPLMPALCVRASGRHCRGGVSLRVCSMSVVLMRDSRRLTRRAAPRVPLLPFSVFDVVELSAIWRATRPRTHRTPAQSFPLPSCTRAPAHPHPTGCALLLS